ncbi:MAG: iron-containing alcohol dehydrogenase [Fuerstiella sp.]
MKPENDHDQSLSGSETLSFDYQPRTRVVFEAGGIRHLGKLAKEFSDGPVLLVTDPGLHRAGHVRRAEQILNASGFEVAVFQDVAENPTTEDVDRCVAFAKENEIRLIVGLGGGSSMDCAKGANFLLTNGGRMQDYKGVGRAQHDMLPMIAIPTTSGTGSEAQSFAVIADAETHMKMPCGDPKAACRVAILDPELTITMPRSVAAATGIDAMTHAIESFVSKKRTLVSQMFAKQAWQLLSTSFPIVMERPQDVEARGQMLLGAHFAGAAIENSMLGSAHATANPLSANFHTVHGIAVGLMLPHVIRWNQPEVGGLYRELAAASGCANMGNSELEATESLASQFVGFLKIAGMPTRLNEAVDQPFDQQMLMTLAGQAAQQWTGTFNPRTMDEQAFLKVYQAALA